MIYTFFVTLLIGFLVEMAYFNFRNCEMTKFRSSTICRVDGTSSDVKGINCGVPQGSCLGPLLFLIYINDLPFCLQKSHVSMYADDMAIACKQTFSERCENAITYNRLWSKHP